LWGQRPTAIVVRDRVQIDGTVYAPVGASIVGPGRACSASPTGAPLLAGGAPSEDLYHDRVRGGGALQISAGDGIQIGLMGSISVDGADGSGPKGAGGHGGSILLESPLVRVDGTLTSSGGQGTSPVAGAYGAYGAYGEDGPIRINTSSGNAEIYIKPSSQCWSQGTLLPYSER
jgi:hypothetical protein